MSASVTTRLHEQFAGEFTDNEQRLCDRFRQLLQACLAGQQSFKQAMLALWSDLLVLREFNYDTEQAIAAGEFDLSRNEPPTFTPDGQTIHEPLSDRERAFVEDAEGLIDWVARNGVSFAAVLQILGHDISELSRDDFNLELTVGPGRRVLPKVSGWAKRNVEPVGEAEDQS